MLQALYKHQHNVSAYLLRDLAWLLTVNEEIDSGYDKDDIMIKWKDWMNKSGREKQSDITTAGSKKKTITICKA